MLSCCDRNLNAFSTNKTARKETSEHKLKAQKGLHDNLSMLKSLAMDDQCSTVLPVPLEQSGRGNAQIRLSI